MSIMIQIKIQLAVFTLQNKMDNFNLFPINNFLKIMMQEKGNGIKRLLRITYIFVCICKIR